MLVHVLLQSQLPACMGSRTRICPSHFAEAPCMRPDWA